MADQWNDNKPAMGNQISADLPDIEENFGHIRSSFERIFQTWSQATNGNASARFNAATGFSDGTYTYTFPTNGVAASSKIMIGNSNTIAWFYLNTAPPGWKVLSTGADTVLGISGGSGAYNVNGGNPDSAATWTISGITAGNQSASHTHTMANGTTTQGLKTAAGGVTVIIDGGELHTVGSGGDTVYAVSTTTGNQSASHNHTISVAGTWRAKASVGKLFQLDTA